MTLHHLIVCYMKNFDIPYEGNKAEVDTFRIIVEKVSKNRQKKSELKEFNDVIFLEKSVPLRFFSFLPCGIILQYV